MSSETIRDPAAEPLRLLIVDDEVLARARLAQLVREGQPAARVVAEAPSTQAAEALLARLGEGAVDAVLLDIGLPGPSGLALASALKAQPRPPAVVFVTAHPQHALQAFELQALDYLTKPVRRERLQQALERVQRWRAANAAAAQASGAGLPGGMSAAMSAAMLAASPVLVLNERGRVLRLPFAEIVTLRADHKLVVVRTTTQQVTVDESLNELEQRLGGDFVRIHRNALVARHAIRALELRPGLDEQGGGDGWAVRVSAGAGQPDEWLPVSRRQVTAVKAALAGETR